SSRMQSSNSRQPAWLRALRYSMPIAMGYIPAAIAFGVLMRAAGFPFWWSLALSVLLYSGAAQFALIPMLAQAIHPLSMWVNVSIINLRHLFYALARKTSACGNSGARVSAR